MSKQDEVNEILTKILMHYGDFNIGFAKRLSSAIQSDSRLKCELREPRWTIGNGEYLEGRRYEVYCDGKYRAAFIIHADALAYCARKNAVEA